MWNVHPKYKDNIYDVETKHIRDYMLIYAFSKITPSIVYFFFKLIHSVQNEHCVVLQKTLTQQQKTQTYSKNIYKGGPFSQRQK